MDIIVDLSKSIAAKNENKTLNKPFRLPSGSKKKFGVYVKNKKGNIIMVKFGDPNMEIKRDNPERRKSFRARHKCDTAKDKTTPKYWSCRLWSDKPVSEITKASYKWDGKEMAKQEDLLKINPSLSEVEEMDDDMCDFCGEKECDCDEEDMD